jgi:hypothetical protein
MQNQALVVNKETDTLFSVAVLFKAGIDVKLITGTKKDPTFGGNLVRPDGQKIRKRLPMWSNPARYTSDQVPHTASKTSAFVPTAAALEALAQPPLPDLEAMQLVHDIWCHSGNDKLEQI